MKHIFFSCLIIGFSLLTANSTSLKVNNNNISVKNWILTSPENNTKEIVWKFGEVLTRSYVKRPKIEFNLINTLPELYIDDVSDHSVTFSDLHINYELGNYYAKTVFNEFTCDEYLQVNISKYVQGLTIKGVVNSDSTNKSFKSKSTFSIRLEDVLISNVRNLQLISSQLVAITANESSKTNIRYRKIQPIVDSTNEEDGPIILSSLQFLLKHLNSYYHKSIDKLILGNITENLPIPEDFQCTAKGIGVYSQLSNKTYIINNIEVDSSRTHTVHVGPVVITGFSNIRRITGQYAWNEDGRLDFETVINISPLYLESDWLISSSRKNEFNGTDSFQITKMRLSSTKVSYQSYSFNVEIKTSVYEWPLTSTDDIFCINLDTLISDSLRKSLYDYSSTYRGY